ncbi:MAG: EAL domain-containing protein [Acidithiobacillus sp.]|nr:EAL domain-containing protein [Acidithiobacillus sp.]
MITRAPNHREQEQHPLALLESWISLFARISRLPMQVQLDGSLEEAQHELLQSILTELDHSGLFHSCAVARALPTEEILLPIAASGEFRQLILENVRAHYGADSPHRQSVTVRAFLEKRTAMVYDHRNADYLLDPTMANWRAFIDAIGIQWIVAAPVFFQGQTWGVMVLSGLGENLPAIEQAAAALAAYIGECLEYLEIRIAEKRNRELLQELSYRDPLTGLQNRRSLNQYLITLNRSPAERSQVDCIVMIDLDDFKQINDQHGHSVGDLLLTQLASRLQEGIRKSDFISRYGGDEFVLILRGIKSHSDLEKILEGIAKRIAQPVVLGDLTLVDMQASMGVAWKNPEDDLETILNRADRALYKAKERKAYREKPWVLWNSIKHRDRRHEKYLPYFQPVYDFQQGSTSRFEILARKQLGNGTILPPAQFLGDLDQEDRLSLTLEMLHAGVDFFQGLASTALRGFSVNIDPDSFLRRSFFLELQKIFQENPSLRGRITLELLESSEFTHSESALYAIQQLKELGVQLSLDDVGTGFSSLLRMKNFPIDSVKMDQDFVKNIARRPQEMFFLSNMQRLACMLRLDFVAEGAETLEIVDALRWLGIGEVQGYAIARPMAAAEFRQYLAQQQPLLAPAPAAPQCYLSAYAGQIRYLNSIYGLVEIGQSQKDPVLQLLEESPLARFLAEQGSTCPPVQHCYEQFLVSLSHQDFADVDAVRSLIMGNFQQLAELFPKEAESA